MMYRIEFRPAALKALLATHPVDARRIRAAVELLGRDPWPRAARPLRGRPGLRVRVGDYRIIYTVDRGVLLIVVIAIGHRSDIYR
jgi:mRNA interferase RelE/StbE